MRSYSVYCYNQAKGNTVASGIYLLSRGRNTGRPAFSPNRNSIVLKCAPQDVEYFYWLCFGLWKAGIFRQILTGSVIELIRLGTLRKVIDKVNHNSELLTDKIPTLQAAIQLEQNYVQQIAKLKDLQIALFYQYMKESA
ncbi:hypothetical protein SAMN05421788_110164 [Filimonas lacunae]|uniref:Type I restriction modification DNA specificity domain-containing protein n=1 Tax=Filimonas lacunae TaxID=477680 RepID=A0A1N7R8Q7_9BACT|nr:hypothetical protein [Filimonas lacunae]SIT31419.1 hypothetical protein SAMN05421788_110164 [Filimonas lacunae]